MNLQSLTLVNYNDPYSFVLGTVTQPGTQPGTPKPKPVYKGVEVRPGVFQRSDGTFYTDIPENEQANLAPTSAPKAAGAALKPGASWPLSANGIVLEVGMKVVPIRVSKSGELEGGSKQRRRLIKEVAQVRYVGHHTVRISYPGDHGEGDWHYAGEDLEVQGVVAAPPKPLTLADLKVGMKVVPIQVSKFGEACCPIKQLRREQGIPAWVTEVRDSGLVVVAYGSRTVGEWHYAPEDLKIVE